MEESEKQANVQVFSEKKKSKIPMILIIIIGVILVSVISSLATYFLVTRGNALMISGANNVNQHM